MLIEGRIKKKDGTEISIKGEKDEVKEILAFVLGKGVTRIPSRKITGKKGFSIVEVVRNLASEGFFETPKSMSAVAKALAKKGYPLSLERISPILLMLVRKGELKREGTAGKYLYSLPKPRRGEKS